MRLKLGTKIDLSERFVRFVRFAGLLDFSDVRFVDFRDKKRETDHRRTDGRTEGRTDPLIEMDASKNVCTVAYRSEFVLYSPK